MKEIKLLLSTVSLVQHSCPWMYLCLYSRQFLYRLLVILSMESICSVANQSKQN